MKNIKNYNNFINLKLNEEAPMYGTYPFFELKKFKNNPIVIIGQNEGLSLNIDDDKYIKNYKNIIEFLLNKQNIELKNDINIFKNINIDKEINVKIIRFEIDNYRTDDFYNLSEDVIDFINYVTEKFGIKHQRYNPIYASPFIRLDLEKSFTFKFI
jgi:hypothetical protein